MGQCDINMALFRERLEIVVEEHTMADITENTGIPEEKISLMKEDIANIAVEDLAEICRHCRVSIDWLLGYSEEKELKLLDSN